MGNKINPSYLIRFNRIESDYYIASLFNSKESDSIVVIISFKITFLFDDEFDPKWLIKIQNEWIRLKID